MKEVKLSEGNRKKHCPECKEVVVIEMKGRDGYCPFCKTKLYSIDTRGK